MRHFMPWERRTIFLEMPEMRKEGNLIERVTFVDHDVPSVFQTRKKNPICQKCKIEMEKQASFTI